MDSFSLRAVRGDLTGANPVDRAKRGSEPPGEWGAGLPLSLLVTAAESADASVLEALLGNIPKVRTPTGGRRCRAGKCHADKAYDNRHCRGYLAPVTGVRIGSRRCRVVHPVGSLPLEGGALDRLVGRVPAAAHPLRPGLRAFITLAMLACARLGYNRLACAAGLNRLPCATDRHARPPWPVRRCGRG